MNQKTSIISDEKRIIVPDMQHLLQTKTIEINCGRQQFLSKNQLYKQSDFPQILPNNLPN